LGHGPQGGFTERNESLPRLEVEDLGMTEAMISHATSNNTRENLLLHNSKSRVQHRAHEVSPGLANPGRRNSFAD
jgi:hypothetical protein